MTWFDAPPDAPFGTTELPYGVFRRAGERARVGVAIGDQVLDVAALARSTGLDPEVFDEPALNGFLALGPAAWAEARGVLQDLLSDEAGRAVVTPHLLAMRDVELLLPFAVADYVDFYASEQHARNLGRILRPGSEPLLPNWKHLPVGYHGRAGTVVVSGTPIRRPQGQRRPENGGRPSFGPSTRLDVEAELGFVVGVGSQLGVPVPTERFADHVFGVVLVNDWSARDLQAWEYVPLGPFLGKSFATSISAWVLPLAALTAAEAPVPRQDPPLLDYLQPPGPSYDVEVEVVLNDTVVSVCPYAEMYYSPAQMLAHLTSNGARLRTGDLFASGTISGALPGQQGSLIELSDGGRRPLPLPGGERSFLADGDEVVLRGSAPGTAGRSRLGEVRGRIS